MKFDQTRLQGAYLIDLQKIGDDRGFFARMFCKEEFLQYGLTTNFQNINTSLSQQKGTLRGMHYQLTPHAEIKIVKCIRGSVFDVIIDLRPDSPTFKKWFGAKLSDSNRTMMYVPKGFAHGFLTLLPDTEVIYLVSDGYAPSFERGVRWNDPSIGIEWPSPPFEVSEKDDNWPSLNETFHKFSSFKNLI
jgi:dTDP-4-dehydrorhamnose 3,5-epimerase